MPDLSNAYRFHRQPHGLHRQPHDKSTGRPAHVALDMAREDVAAGQTRYPSNGYSFKSPRPADSPVYFESGSDAARAGFRFVGYADSIGGRSIDHKGWYTASEFQDDTYRGAVFQMTTGRHGAMRFVAGYQESCSGGFVVDVRGRGAVHIETVVDPYDRERMTDLDACRDAARAADEFARIAAKRECEYQEAWRAGSEWSDLGDEIADTRKRLLAALAERRAIMGAHTPALCAILRTKAGEMLRAIYAARERRRELEDGYWNREAFNDGADAVVL